MIRTWTPWVRGTTKSALYKYTYLYLLLFSVRRSRIGYSRTTRVAVRTPRQRAQKTLDLLVRDPEVFWSSNWFDVLGSLSDDAEVSSYAHVALFGHYRRSTKTWKRLMDTVRRGVDTKAYSKHGANQTYWVPLKSSSLQSLANNASKV